jgi:hypothetical protein
VEIGHFVLYFRRHGFDVLVFIFKILRQIKQPVAKYQECVSDYMRGIIVNIVHRDFLCAATHTGHYCSIYSFWWQLFVCGYQRRFVQRNDVFNLARFGYIIPVGVYLILSLFTPQ